MEWKHVLAYITGSVDQELLVRNEYLVTENRILRQQITGRIRLSNGERKTLAAIGKKLRRQALADVATIVTPETILAWHRMLVAKRFACVPLPARSPNLNAYAERWVRSVKEEALSQLILFGERSLQYVLTEYVTHFHQERPHQGKGNVVLMPTVTSAQVTTRGAPIRCRERLGGLLKYYDRAAA
jgi:hypothetical protein